MTAKSAPSTDSPQKRRILVVDDHPVVRLGLRNLLAQESDLEVCGEAEDAEAALRVAEATHPDAAIVDISLQGESGLELVSRLKALRPTLRILVSSIHDETLFASRALRVGALGYVGKETALENIVEALRQVLRGEIYLSTRMARRLLQGSPNDKEADRDPVRRLSNRELEVFTFIGQGQTTQQIARHLSVSAKTVETHRKNIKTKLGLQNSAQLARAAFHWSQEHS